VTHSVTGKAGRSRRTTPDSDDWLRRYLRRLKIPCEGEALKAALRSLDGPTWDRLKAAWRKHTEREGGPFATGMARALIHGKRLGPIWQRLIAWGVISEADAYFLATEPSRMGGEFSDFFADSGAKFVLACALTNMLQASGQGQAQAKRLPGAVAAVLRLQAKEAADPDTLDDRVVAAMESSPYSPEEIRRGLAELKAQGHYERIIAEAVDEDDPPL
jgi:hypothetical protein